MLTPNAEKVREWQKHYPFLAKVAARFSICFFDMVSQPIFVSALRLDFSPLKRHGKQCYIRNVHRVDSKLLGRFMPMAIVVDSRDGECLGKKVLLRVDPILPGGWRNNGH
ncbi:MAG: hypothetical protein C0616_06625 [Desulfuromonas sp.]|nr:MAG: hypothetical protein C0616_06625 [Desulfuromonas sp.]